jgi:hypothetical protein
MNCYEMRQKCVYGAPRFEENLKTSVLQIIVIIIIIVRNIKWSQFASHILLQQLKMEKCKCKVWEG